MKEFKDNNQDVDGNGIPDNFDALLTRSNQNQPTPVSQVIEVDSSQTTRPIIIPDAINRKALIILLIIGGLIGLLLASSR